MANLLISNILILYEKQHYKENRFEVRNCLVKGFGQAATKEAGSTPSKTVYKWKEIRVSGSQIFIMILIFCMQKIKN